MVGFQIHTVLHTMNCFAACLDQYRACYKMKLSVVTGCQSLDSVRGDQKRSPEQRKTQYFAQNPFELPRRGK